MIRGAGNPGLELVLTIVLLAGALIGASIRRSGGTTGARPGRSPHPRARRPRPIETAGAGDPGSERVSGPVGALDATGAAVPPVSSLPPADGAPMTPVPVRVIPPPEGTPEEYVVRSASFGGGEYRCDLAAQTCSCPNFQFMRRHFPPNDLARLCKHLREGARAHRMLQTDDALLAGLLMDVWNDRVLRGTMAGGDVVFCAYAVDGEWIDVLARQRRPGDPLGAHTGAYARFGFNAARNGWSYGEGPEGAREIRRMLKTVLWHQARDAAAMPAPVRRALAEDAARDSAQQEAARATRQAALAREAADRTANVPCRVCGRALPVASEAPEGTLVTCGMCGITNVLTHDGADRPERLAIYRRYDGDWQTRAPGLFGELEHRREREMAALKAQKAAGELSEAEYRSRRAKLSREHAKAAEQLHAQKNAELEVVRSEERAIYARVNPKLKRARGAGPAG